MLPIPLLLPVQPLIQVPQKGQGAGRLTILQRKKNNTNKSCEEKTENEENRSNLKDGNLGQRFIKEVEKKLQNSETIDQKLIQRMDNISVSLVNENAKTKDDLDKEQSTGTDTDTSIDEFEDENKAEEEKEKDYENDMFMVIQGETKMLAGRGQKNFNLPNKRKNEDLSSSRERKNGGKKNKKKQRKVTV